VVSFYKKIKKFQSSIPTLTSAAAAVVAGTKSGFSTASASASTSTTTTTTSNGTMSPGLVSLQQQNFASAVLNGKLHFL
jgi:hypothetical protein